MRRALVVLSAMFAAALMLVTPSAAYWTAAGSGAGAGATGTLAAPTGVSVPANSLPGVAVAWTASAGPPVPDGYYVTRASGGTTVAACASSALALLTGTSCTDSAVPDGAYTYTVTAVYRSWTAASAPSGSVDVWTPAKLAVTGQPTTAVAGTAIAPAVAVTVQTAAGVAVPLAGRSVTVAIGTNPGGGTLSGTVSRTTDSSGVATFANLSIDKSGTGYTLTATSSSLTSATSAAFAVSAAAAGMLMITSAPVSGAASTSATLGPITVAIRDPFGNTAIAPTGGTSVTLSSDTTGTPVFSVTSGGSTTTTVTIPALASSTTFFYGDTMADTPTLTASGLTTNATQVETISAAAPAKFAFTSAPVSGVGSATATTGPITVQRQDAFGNPASPASTTTVNLATTSTGATKFFSAISGSGTATAVTIPVNVSTVTFYYADTQAATQTITASGLTTNASQFATITAGAANKLEFGQQPTNTPHDVTITPTVTARILDQFGNQTTSTLSVTIAIANNAGSGLLGAEGELVGTLTVNAVLGVATFSDLQIHGTGLLGAGAEGNGYTLRVTRTSAPTLTQKVSNAFNIT